jgi:cytochrome c-type biogenesis protein CcmH/NrfG
LYERTLRLTPNDLDLALRLAAVLADSRDTAVRNGPRATALAAQAAQATRRQDVRALEVLAVALGSSGRFAEAAATAREAAALARGRGESRRADALEYRAVAYDYAAQQGFVPQR